MDKNTSVDDKQLGLKWEKENIPYSETYGDYFYSTNNGRDECRHVFIEGNRLSERLIGTNSFTVAELGFGTGLNFLETWDFWLKIREQHQTLKFVSFERHPLNTRSMQQALSQWPELEKHANTLLNFWASKNEIPTEWQVDQHTTLQVIFGDAISGLNDWQGKADAWYLDGFSPSKNPDMWSAELMKQLHSHTRPNGTFATYTSAGWVRRNLVDAGFEVSRVRGHGNKRHMSVGFRKGNSQLPL